MKLLLFYRLLYLIRGNKDKIFLFCSELRLLYQEIFGSIVIFNNEVEKNSRLQIYFDSYYGR